MTDDPPLSATPLGPYTFYQPKKGHLLTGDPLFLTDFVLPVEEEHIIDIGTGAGAIALLLAAKCGGHITGVEIEPFLVAIARKNVKENGLADRIEIIERDYRELRGALKEASFDLIVTNPPYIKKGEGRVSPNELRALSRYELKGSIKELASVSAYLLSNDGRFCAIFPYPRKDELISELKVVGLHSRRIMLIHSGEKKEAKLFCIEAVRSEEELLTEAPLFI